MQNPEHINNPRGTFIKKSHCVNNFLEKKEPIMPKKVLSLSKISVKSTMQDFVHLHVHSQYSILDGQASIKKLVDKAISDGMKGIALTDHGNMMGVKEFYNYVSKINKGKE